jgi:hypothetical protein
VLSISSGLSIPGARIGRLGLCSDVLNWFDIRLDSDMMGTDGKGEGTREAGPIKSYVMRLETARVRHFLLGRRLSFTMLSTIPRDCDAILKALN